MPSHLGIRITPNILVICPDFSYSYTKGFLWLSSEHRLLTALKLAAAFDLADQQPWTYAGPKISSC
jgi:hypothetical protein